MEDLASDVRRVLRGLSASVENVTGSSAVARTLCDPVSREYLELRRNKREREREAETERPGTMALKILLVYCFIVNAASLVLSSPEDHHRVPPRSDHRVMWPAWYRDRLLHVRHDRPGDGRVVPEITTTRSPWMSRAQVTTTRSPSPQQANSMAWYHRVEQRTLGHNFSGAVAMAEHGGTRAIAYAGYHGNHRHQPREAVTQSYQLIPTTTPTYTRYHPG